MNRMLNVNNRQLPCSEVQVRDRLVTACLTAGVAFRYDKRLKGLSRVGPGPASASPIAANSGNSNHSSSHGSNDRSNSNSNTSATSGGSSSNSSADADASCSNSAGRSIGDALQGSGSGNDDDNSSRRQPSGNGISGDSADARIANTHSNISAGFRSASSADARSASPGVHGQKGADIAPCESDGEFRWQCQLHDGQTVLAGRLVSCFFSFKPRHWRNSRPGVTGYREEAAYSVLHKEFE